MNDYTDSNNFVITKEDKLFYFELEKIFLLAQKCNNSVNGVLNNNSFQWTSEASGLPEFSHKLTITKENECFNIKFIRNPENYSPINTCYINFCLSGSGNIEVANAFSTMLYRFESYDIRDSNKKILKYK